jgi:microsomal dipeptidase-like Zn-dependent dipeptidase
MDTIADLRKFRQVLESRGYPSTALEGIFSGNFLKFLETAWR